MRARSAAHFAILGALALAPFACADARDPSSAREAIVVPIAVSASAPSDAVDTAAASVARDAAPDADTEDGARRNMFGDGIGDSFGAGGVGPSGVGEGSGGDGEGIGLGKFGGLPHGAGQGIGSARPDAGRAPAALRMREGAVSVNGRLPEEIVRRIVRQNFGRFRLCYQDGLKKKPKLAGTVTTRFTIDASGAVSSTSDAGSTLPDKDVVSCVVRGFFALAFPQPEGGIVVVSYPISFAPGE